QVGGVGGAGGFGAVGAALVAAHVVGDEDEEVGLTVGRIRRTRRKQQDHGNEWSEEWHAPVLSHTAPEGRQSIARGGNPWIERSNPWIERTHPHQVWPTPPNQSRPSRAAIT